MRLSMVSLLLLAACNTPSPAFRGVPPTRVTMGELAYDVRVRGNMAEAIRVNTQWAPRFGPLARSAELAMEQVSGCDVTKISGDQALAFGKLDCGQRKAPHPPARAPREFECETISRWVNAGLEQETTVLDCIAVY